ncbi:D-amino-acid dehydrogenase [Advenella kashmirensis WT001]|uniref:D-amino-acid dehydrogenase n=1 Tax=Advenella kashmirensis (strain DSM 17095 / LMG 22695 / WT001) TaxID=1036672 RepID=I3UFA0_ADVKW|nr:D-amino-acid dehydrogenase [Advenella kashmirensis WT001]
MSAQCQANDVGASMHIIVIGAGIIGMTSAYYLAKKGYQVTVVDACAGPGQMTSKANGAQLSYSFVAPLAEPAVLPKLLRGCLVPNHPCHCGCVQIRSNGAGHWRFWPPVALKKAGRQPLNC